MLLSFLFLLICGIIPLKCRILYLDHVLFLPVNIGFRFLLNVNITLYVYMHACVHVGRQASMLVDRQVGRQAGGKLAEWHVGSHSKINGML